MPKRKRVPATLYAENLMSLIHDYDTDQECRDRLEHLRWPDGVCCPRCQSDKISRIVKRKQFDCDSCRYQFSVTSGTIFHDSHLGLPKWFIAIYLMTESKKGISANQMRRTIAVSYKTAWYLCHRIREAMYEDAPTPLSGTVEADETYIGGKRAGGGRGNGNYRKNKTMVMAVVQRGGAIRMSTGKTDSKVILQRFVRSHAPNPARIMTDEHPSYVGLADSDTTHESVNHSAKEYVRGDVHTNTAESAFSLFKRSIVGSFHQVSGKHLDRYLDEFEWRFNNLKNPYLFRDTLRKLVAAGHIEYKELTA